jgi:hypothetical protein
VYGERERQNPKGLSATFKRNKEIETGADDQHGRFGQDSSRRNASITGSRSAAGLAVMRAQPGMPNDRNRGSAARRYVLVSLPQKHRES